MDCTETVVSIRTTMREQIVKLLNQPWLYIPKYRFCEVKRLVRALQLIAIPADIFRTVVPVLPHPSPAGRTFFARNIKPILRIASGLYAAADRAHIMRDKRIDIGYPQQEIQDRSGICTEQDAFLPPRKVSDFLQHKKVECAVCLCHAVQLKIQTFRRICPVSVFL